MEVTNTKKRVDKTQFNVDISKQFVPYWNGLLHLVGSIENGIIIRRYDWKKMIEECEQFERDYMDTENFCEVCGFYDVLPSTQRIITEANAKGVYDCKTISSDNDIVYSYCIEKQKERRTLVIIATILGVIALFMAVAAVAVYVMKNNLMKNFHK